MIELLEAAVSPANILPTFLFAFVMLYWITVIIGLLDMEFLDFDLDAEVDVDADIDVDTGTATAEVNISWLNHVLAFFNLGQIPFMVFLTFLILPMWALAILANDFLNNDSFFLSLLILAPVFLVCLFIAKFLTIPFVKIFASLDDSTALQNAVGKMCMVLIKTTDNRLGQASVKVKGAPLRINVKTYEGMKLKKGDSALVIEYNQEGKYYLVEPIEKL